MAIFDTIKIILSSVNRPMTPQEIRDIVKRREVLVEGIIGVEKDEKFIVYADYMTTGSVVRKSKERAKLLFWVQGV